MNGIFGAYNTIHGKSRAGGQITARILNASINFPHCATTSKGNKFPNWTTHSFFFPVSLLSVHNILLQVREHLKIADFRFHHHSHRTKNYPDHTIHKLWHLSICSLGTPFTSKKKKKKKKIITEYRIASLSNRRIDLPLNMSVPYILLKLFPHATKKTKPSKQTKTQKRIWRCFFCCSRM